ncbi:hypothetical protein NGRA_1991 [Nosema granulosis]|uniref:Uncharacterized protein n=1 Tax=Nosema granulosis TaxID=83296 RepID=A0A9P6KZ23_9MICR|nr:hypothetical protein NGRA_1991 [Nosema granulosis]
MPISSKTQVENNEKLFDTQKGNFHNYAHMFYALHKRKYFAEPERIIYTNIYTNMLQFCRETLEIMSKCEGIDVDYDFYKNLLIVGDKSSHKKVSRSDLFKPVVDFLYDLLSINSEFYYDVYYIKPKSYMDDQEYLQLFLDHYRAFVEKTERFLGHPHELRLKTEKPWYSFLFDSRVRYHVFSKKSHTQIYNLYGRLVESTNRILLTLENCKYEIFNNIKRIKDSEIKLNEKIKKENCQKISRDDKKQPIEGIEILEVGEKTTESCKTPYDLSNHYNHLTEDKNNCKEKVKCGLIPPRQPYLYCNNGYIDRKRGVLNLPLAAKYYEKTEYTNENNCITTYNRWKFAPTSYATTTNSYATTIYPSIILITMVVIWCLRKIFK